MKRFFRFTLRTLACLTLLAGLFFAYIAHSLKAVQSANIAIEDTGAVGGVALTYPKWLRRYIGDDRYFRHWVSFTAQKGRHHGVPRFDDETLRDLVPHLNRFSGLNDFSFLNVDITDAAIPALSRLVYLEKLRLDSDFISDDGILILDSLDGLDHLILHCPKVTSGAIQHLKERKPSLRVMHFVREPGKKTRLEEYDFADSSPPPPAASG